MADSGPESGVLKRKLEEDEAQKTKETELSSPPAKIRATDESTSERDPSKANVVNVAPSTSGSSSSQTIATESSGESYGEREKMQWVVVASHIYMLLESLR